MYIAITKNTNKYDTSSIKIIVLEYIKTLEVVLCIFHIRE